MRCFVKSFLWITLGVMLSAEGHAQADICRPPSPSVPSEMRTELARIQAEERARLEATRFSWVVNLIPLKNAPSAAALQPLCIFDIEVVPHVAAKLVGIRAPKELMPAVEEALKRLDVPPPETRTIDLTAYVLVVADSPRPTLMPLPQELQGVANQLKGLVPAGTFYLLDTVVARGVENSRLQVSGSTSLSAQLSVREGGTPVVRLDNLNVGIQGIPNRGSASINTNIDLPVDSYVVVGKATTYGGNAPEIEILVMTARLSK